MGSPTDLQYIHQRTLSKGDGILKLTSALVVSREYIVKFREDGVELPEELRCNSDKLIATLNVALTRTTLQLPLDGHQQQVEHTSRRTSPTRIRIDCHLPHL